MLLVADECVTPQIADLFVQRNHQVVLVARELGRSTPDPIIAEYADRRSAVVLTWNYRHFLQLMKACSPAGVLLFPNMGLISYRCPPAKTVSRFGLFMDAIEYHYEFLQQLTDKRINVQVGHDKFIVFR
jgi:Domain of unknown function (DUF5615)